MTIEKARKELESSKHIEQNRIHKDIPLIEALEIAIAALEKQIPKNPKRGVCPNCNSRHIYAATLTTAECFKHCGDCGQALDWSGDERRTDLNARKPPKFADSGAKTI